MIALPLLLALAGSDPHAHTLWIDFAGHPISPGEDITAGQAVCVDGEFAYPRFLGDGRVAQFALTEARRLLAPYDVRVVAERPPASLEYTHVRVGARPELFLLDPGLNGLSCNVDCGDALPTDTAFVFSDKFVDTAVVPDDDDAAARGLVIGRIAVHEAGHAWGLEHAGGSESVMSRFPTTAATDFVVGCAALDLDGDPVCGEIHEDHCAAGAQDADAELHARFGAGAADVTPPEIAIVSPNDGDEFLPGTVITFEVEAADDRGAVGWALVSDALAYRRDMPPGTYVVDLALPAGRLDLRAEAIDHGGNLGHAVVTVLVAEPDEIADEPRASCACTYRSPREPAPIFFVGVLSLWTIAVRRRSLAPRARTSGS